ncbi:MAG TPA: 30S ribosomal protein S20 [Oligoflexia bacterium]|nr:30S ribosomal protein S20 [Oligoflexia bacterium]
MATHASAEKRNRQNKIRRTRNRSERATIASAVKRVRQLVESGAKDEARTQLKAASRLLDKAVNHGLVHKNNARRRISRLAQLVG